MEAVLIGAAWIVLLMAAVLVTMLVLVASAPAPIDEPKDVFGFAQLHRKALVTDLPILDRYPARDGADLAYRLYESAADQILIFVHGSSYHGAGYHTLARAISASGAAKVVVPNLRGHYLSGRHRGDVKYIGQLEDDIVDLIGFLRRRRLQGPIVLGGHSSGGGFVVRFAGGGHGAAISRFLVLSPIIPLSPSVKGGNAGGWAQVHMRRLYGLLGLNIIGIHGLDGLSIIEFNKPVQFWDGTETLAYSHRLNASYHPRFKYGDDLRGLRSSAMVLVGADDQAIDVEGLRAVLTKYAPHARMDVLPAVDHFGIFEDAATLNEIALWLKGAGTEATTERSGENPTNPAP